MPYQKTVTNIIPISSRQIRLSVVIPVFNEQENIHEFHRRLVLSLEESEGTQAEIIFVNDGSTDATMSLLSQLMRQDRRIRILELSRNFGKEAAMTAGLNHAGGDAVIIIDADLQDPPELIPDMVRQWRNGHDVINMRRISRAGETWLKKRTAQAFYRCMSSLGSVRMPEEVGDYRLLSRVAVDALLQLPERTRFMKGLFAWIGFDVKEIRYHREARHAGKTKWNYWRLWNLALEGITSHTVAPLKIASYVGLLCVLSAFGCGLYIAAASLFSGNPSSGVFVLTTIMLLGGLQMLFVGVVGEYLARIFIEAKGRPLYLLKRHHATAEPRLNIFPAQASK